MQHKIEILTVNNSQMELFTFLPESEGPHRGLVVAMHLPVGHTGIENDKFTLDACKRYCDAGYAIACPFIFHYWPKEAEMQIKRDEFRDDRVIDDCQAAFDWLADNESVDAQRIGIVGHCWGGRVAWVSAVNNPKYRACAIFYGGRIKLPMGENARRPIELANQMPCPVLGLFGNEDEVPSPKDVDDYAAALSAAGIEHQFHRYDGAGHGFQDEYSKDRYNKEASEDAWGKALAFFNSKLK